MKSSDKSSPRIKDVPQKRTLREIEDILLNLDDDESLEGIREKLAQKHQMSTDEFPEFALHRRSIDARGGQVRFLYQVRIGEKVIEEELAPLKILKNTDNPVIIVGSGPAGLFCAYELTRLGVPSIVLERGKKVQARRKDLKLINQKGQINTESNYCYGEGGAGTFSDGKLYTRSDKRGNVREFLRILVSHGANENILLDARPHIGSNKLPVLLTEIRERLEECGVQFLFDSKVTELLDKEKQITGVVLANGDKIDSRAVVLATGHSAKDIYQMCLKQNVALEAKDFALGVRIEHPQELINEIQYGRDNGHPKLPSAAYRFADTKDNRGVFSFCMCPGGFIVPASTADGELVVNGMSPSKRNSKFANSGFVININTEDVYGRGFKTPLAGLEFQNKIEKYAFELGGGSFKAPAQRITDFLDERVSQDLPECSYQPGLTAVEMGEVLDCTGLSIAKHIERGLFKIDERMRGFISREAVIVGVESRTSSPVRIVRHKKTLESMSHKDLYPAAEGAGYAGGIVSAAIDGMRIAQIIAEKC